MHHTSSKLCSCLLIPLFLGCQSPESSKIKKGGDLYVVIEDTDVSAFSQVNVLIGAYPGVSLWPTWTRRDGKRQDAELGTAFTTVRESEGWKAFISALEICDRTVNELLDENILDWSASGQKIASVNQTRNAWRHASTFGITPPSLPRGRVSFSDAGLFFTVTVRSDSMGILTTRSPRGQVIGIFDLLLRDENDQHVTSHMLQSTIWHPDRHLNYPWNIVMATDTIFIDDIWVELDRVNGNVLVGERFGEKKKKGAESTEEQTSGDN